MARAERASRHCTVVSKSGGGGLEFPHLPSSDRVGVFLYSGNKPLLVLSGLCLQLSASRRPTDRRPPQTVRPSYRHTRTHSSFLTRPHSRSHQSPLSPSSLPLFLPPPRLWQGRRREEVKAATLLLRARDSKRGGERSNLRRRRFAPHLRRFSTPAHGERHNRRRPTEGGRGVGGGGERGRNRSRKAEGRGEKV